MKINLFRITPSRGFVHTVISAYEGHNNLKISPDDIWTTILIQFSLFVNANAEEFRHHFVKHDGQKRLVFKAAALDDWDSGFRSMEGILKSETSPEISKFITNNFTTTTERTRIVSTLIFMSTLQKYFTYHAFITCGIPQITILGTKADWEDILGRVEFLKTFGEVPTKWSNMLGPIIEQFISAKQGNINETFWSDIVQEFSICGYTEINGWITVFASFGSEGEWRGDPQENQNWPTISLAGLVSELVTVPMTIDNYGTELNGTIIVGNMGSEIGEDNKTLSSYAGWAVTTDDLVDNI